MLYAASDEWHQSFVAGRVPELWDWTADAIGVGFALIIYIIYRKIKRGSL